MNAKNNDLFRHQLDMEHLVRSHPKHLVSRTIGARMRMKALKLLQFAMFLICFGYSSLSFCANEAIGERQEKHIPKEKRYVNASHLHFGKNDIYVFLEENWMKTDAVFSDENGFYVIDPVGAWICAGCGYYNTSNNWSCDGCGRRKN